MARWTEKEYNAYEAGQPAPRPKKRKNDIQGGPVVIDAVGLLRTLELDNFIYCEWGINGEVIQTAKIAKAFFDVTKL